ncbi:MAG TPA: hypothetical protein VG897_06810 [Terriglobales bacterium]|nr:hypothetical protein [Terriglobales bacterium]
MKRFFFLLVILVAVSGFGQAPSPAPAQKPGPIVPENDNSRKARALLQQMIQALGGQAYLNIQTIEQEGRSYSYYNGQPNSGGIPFWRFYKFPDKDRTELTKQRDVVYITVGDKGYEKTYKGVALMEPDQLKDYQRRHDHSLEIILRKWLPDPTTALFYDGPAVAEQKPCDSVTLMNDKNDSVTIFIDSIHHLPVKKTFQWRDPSDNLKNTEDEVFDNWRVEGGIPTPHTILRSHNGDTTNQRFLTVVRYNTNIPDSMFDVSVTYDPYKKSGPRH